jgi:hypothetical protein
VGHCGACGGVIKTTMERTYINQVDLDKRSLPVTTIEHNDAFLSYYFVTSGYATLASAETRKFVLTTSIKPVHFFPEVIGSQDTTYCIIESISSSGGTEQTIVSRNRNDAGIPTVAVSLTSTISDTSSMILCKSFGTKNSSTEAAESNEFVLRPDRKYGFVISSNANSNLVSWELNWFEKETD